jgi:prepilin-type N-terminal cleavage/methylation domain-containing protein
MYMVWWSFQGLLLRTKSAMKNRGFTFIELLVVVTIIMVLTTAGAVSYRQTNAGARDSRRKADLEQIRSALELCRAENGAYPATLGTTVVCGGITYLTIVPIDPKDGQSGYTYSYTQGSATTYTLCADTMESENETSPYCVTNP